MEGNWDLVLLLAGDPGGCSALLRHLTHEYGADLKVPGLRILLANDGKIIEDLSSYFGGRTRSHKPKHDGLSTICNKQGHSYTLNIVHTVPDDPDVLDGVVFVITDSQEQLASLYTRDEDASTPELSQLAEDILHYARATPRGRMLGIVHGYYDDSRLPYSNSDAEKNAIVDKVADLMRDAGVKASRPAHIFLDLADSSSNPYKDYAAKRAVQDILRTFWMFRSRKHCSG